MASQGVRERFDRIASGLATEGVVSGMMFRRRALKVTGEAFLMLEDDGVVIRLPDGCEARTEALSQDGADVFRVEGGRVTVTDWVTLPAHTAERWTGWARAAAHELVAEAEAERHQRPGRSAPTRRHA